MPNKSLKLVFPNSKGEELAANLELPAGPPAAFAVFAHCFTCSRNIHAASRISRALCQRGIAVLRFDFTGLGSSEGDFANTNFSSNVEDLLSAAEALRERYQAPALLVGHSLGGAAVLVAGSRIPEVRAVATLAAPSDTEHLLGLFDADLAAIERDGRAEVNLAGRRFPITKQFVDDVSATRLSDSIRVLARPLLILHSPTDELVDIDHARRIYEAARHPKSFIALDGADHLLSREPDSEYVATQIAAWASRYIQVEAAASDAPSHGSEEGVVWVEEKGTPYANHVFTSGHTLTADEPESVGGGDSGPNPYEYLLAALGSCTSMTLRMYANHKGWPLEHVAVRLRHSKIHAADCESCESDSGKIDRIERELDLRGPLQPEQLERLLEIADRCPVHRTLMGDKEIRTRLLEQAR